MGLEAATFISGLVATNPVGATDPVSQGDDHIRLLKSTLLATFAAITGAVTATHGELNQLHGGVIASVGDGTVGAPTFSFASDTNTGMYHRVADSTSFSAGGALVADIDSSGIRSIAGLFRSDADGSAAAPVFSWTSDSNTGFYRVAADDIAVVTGGAIRSEWTTTTFVSTVPILAPATGVSYTFIGDSDTGLGRVASDDLAITTGGSLRGEWTNSSFVTYVPVLAQDGAVGAPSYTFASNNNTGIYRSGADTLAISAGGAAVASFANGVVVLGNASGYILDLGSIGTSLSATAGGATALPATPLGYATIAVGGNLRKFAYY